MKYLTNAFNTKMLTNTKHKVSIEPSTFSEVMKNRKECINAIGHHKIAKLLHLKPNRIQVQLQKGDIAYVISTTTRKKQLYKEPDQINFKKVTVIE